MDSKKDIIKIEYNDSLIAIIIPADYKNDGGIDFFTPNDFSQQLAYMKHPKGHIIEPHVHNVVVREVHYTKETLIIRNGSVRVDLYDNNRDYLESRILGKGDIILLNDGGHGFKALDDLEMIEIKQGPYAEIMTKPVSLEFRKKRSYINNYQGEHYGI